MKIAVCIPCQDYAKAKFTLSLGRLLIATQKNRPRTDIFLFMAGSSMLTESRNMLIETALAAKADFLLLLDSDHTFPDSALLKLLALKKLFVAANYARRADRTGPTARKFDGNGKSLPVLSTQEKARAGDLEDVDQVGLGLCLIHASVFRQLKPPFFHFDLGPDGETIGEDTYFCRKVRSAGIPIYVDHGLSWEVGHIHHRILTNADAVEQERARAAAP